jgi:Trk-type K+ transport system membrane component
VDVSTVLTRFGQVILTFIMQFGGVGLMLMIAGIWILFKKKISLRERTMVMTDQNQLKSGGVIKLVKDILILMLTIELIGFIILSFYFYYQNYFPLDDALFQAYFLTVSLFTNAGFDITGESLVVFANNQDYIALTIFMLLIFSGSVGYWVLVETKEFIVAKLNKRKFKFSIFVKIIFFMHILLYLLGALMFMILESNHFLIDKTILDQVYYGLFMSITTRNAGFTTIDMSQISNSTQWLFSALMFIGASPNSVGGGIRTTTLVILMGAIYSFAIGRNQVIVFKRAVKESTVYRSLLIFTVGIMITFTSILIISIVEPYLDLNLIAFEVFSAFGTTGLTLGITNGLHIVSKLVIITNMFIGRIGIVSLLLFFKHNKDVQNRVKYPEIDMIIGA